jgi:hypothetical protein
MRNLAELRGGALGNPGAAAIAIEPGPGLAQVGGLPLGKRTGAPPRTALRLYQVAPAVLGQPTLIVEADAQSRSVILTAPFVNFTVYVGDAGVKITDFSLPAGLPYEVIIPGNQPLYATTDAPIYLPLRVHTAPLLVGDRER